MDKQLIWAFIEQIRFQCIALIHESEQTNSALAGGQDLLAFVHIQNLLAIATNIQLAFWGQKKQRAEARKGLRAVLSISDDSIWATTEMRNNFLHFDERLEHWWNSSKEHSLVDLVIVHPLGALGGPADTDRFREYDPSTGDVVFWGQHFNVKQFENEARNLLQKLTPALDALY